MTPSARATDSPIVARAFHLQGLVQGQGVRPTVARLARQLNLAGTVRNAMQGVEVQVVGQPRMVDCFLSRLQVDLAATLIVDHDCEINVDRASGFRILDSLSGADVETIVPLDLAVCHACIADVSSPSSRRYRYPFTSCTRCGPRYSIIRRMPFDRQRTSMADFAQCAACSAEYEDPADRRFHAQTNACATCGPQCWCVDQQGRIVAGASEAIEFSADAISHGKIVAVKGLGGYQLVCDASDDMAVKRLRCGKGRPSKPLPIMTTGIDQAREIAQVGRRDQIELTGPAAPIVLVRANPNSNLSTALHAGLKEIGIMLPTTPLHWLLCDLVDRPLVVTSANLHGSPIIFENEAATEQLRHVADVWLHHDRRIERPIDDSVVRCVGQSSLTLRAGRGLAPMTIPLRSSQSAIALGGHQKVALGICTGKQTVLGPHVGDMESESSRQRLLEQQQQLTTLYNVSPQRVVRDHHPDYFTSRFADNDPRPCVAVQHHHAHVAAAMLEHNLDHQMVLGFAFDGTGFGADGTVWGGEVLLATTTDFERIANLRPFPLPLGERSIREPWRVALSLVQQSCDRKSMAQCLSRFDLPDRAANLQLTLGRGVTTSSMGRLFDGVAALALSISTVHDDGEAAMLLESACDESETAAYRFALTGTDPIEVDWRQLVRQVVDDLPTLAPGSIAMKFHRAIAAAVVAIAAKFRQYPALLCGGVFQNRLLLELIHEQATVCEVAIKGPGRIPTGDGGLAVGQLTVAAGQQQMTPVTASTRGE